MVQADGSKATTSVQNVPDKDILAPYAKIERTEDGNGMNTKDDIRKAVAKVWGNSSVDADYAGYEDTVINCTLAAAIKMIEVTKKDAKTLKIDARRRGDKIGFTIASTTIGNCNVFLAKLKEMGGNAGYCPGCSFKCQATECDCTCHDRMRKGMPG